jgi:hypothetical protein
MDQLMERIRAHRVEPTDQITVEYLFYGAWKACPYDFFTRIKRST